MLQDIHVTSDGMDVMSNARPTIKTANVCFYNQTYLLKVKFHYAIWFEAGQQPASNLSATSFKPASIMEFGFKQYKNLHILV